MNQSNPSGFSDYLVLNDTSAKVPGTYDVFRPHTSSVISLGADSVVSSSTAYVAYCFAPVSGYSSFGTYTGNGSTNGPFIYTGHRSRWIMIKRTDTAGFNWLIFDALRLGYNYVSTYLRANTSDAEGTDVAPGTGSWAIDILSNGFKHLDTTGTLNAAGGTYIYAAFAESPFAYSRAR
jgi:hypothetical protein